MWVYQNHYQINYCCLYYLLLLSYYLLFVETPIFSYFDIIQIIIHHKSSENKSRINSISQIQKIIIKLLILNHRTSSTMNQQNFNHEQETQLSTNTLNQNNISPINLNTQSNLNIIPSTLYQQIDDIFQIPPNVDSSYDIFLSFLIDNNQSIIHYQNNPQNLHQPINNTQQQLPQNIQVNSLIPTQNGQSQRQPSYPTKNFLPKFKSSIMNFLKIKHGQKIQNDLLYQQIFVKKKGINMKDYQNLFNKYKDLSQYFSHKVPYRHLMKSRGSSENKKIFLPYIRVLQKAFNDGRFDNIN